jgi:hypothetical protein
MVGSAHVLLGDATVLLKALGLIIFELRPFLEEEGEFLKGREVSRDLCVVEKKGREGERRRHTLVEAMLCFRRFSSVTMPICNGC